MSVPVTPMSKSVTRTFYERGWRGINIEPAEGTWRRICDRRPRDINLRVAVGDTIGDRPFFLVDDGGGLSTLREEIAKAHAGDGRLLEQVTCPVVTLARICEDHVAGPIHFMKIDVEGAEREVLQGGDFGRFRPWIVLIEATYPNSTVQTHAEWEELLIAARYRFAYFDGLNRFYVAEEFWARLGAAFAQPPNVFDNFIRADEAAAVARAQAAEGRADAAEQQGAAAEQQGAAAEQRAAAAEQRAEAAGLQAAAAEQLAAEADARAGTAAESLQRAQSERDDFEQEMFEVNRHAAWLTQERQTLLWRMGEQEAELARSKAETEKAAALAGQVDRLDFELAKAKAELEKAKAELEKTGDYYRNWIDSIYSSTSWKFALPVRAARRLLVSAKARR